MPESPPSRRPRVLVVDDQFPMAETLAEGLLDRGYEAVPIASRREAAAMLEREPFDALVTDLRMAQLDGLELLAVSRKIGSLTGREDRDAPPAAVQLLVRPALRLGSRRTAEVGPRPRRARRTRSR